MISYLRGKVINIAAESAIVLVGGVGYEVFCSGSAFSNMREGAECELYTYLQISEVNGITLYGFSTMGEKEMFLKLISVSGVGPKMGLSVLTYMSADDFARAIATGDVKGLAKVKGLGKKTAERLILELRESISAPAGFTAESGIPAAKVTSGDEDAVVALISLGFTRTEAEKGVAKAKQSGAKTVEEIIMNALRSM